MDNLIGMTFERWRKALRENHYDIDRPYWKRAAKMTMASLMTSSAIKSKLKPFESAIQKSELLTPTFVLGHWRSGTTFLHNVLLLDDRWNSPNIGDVSNPFIFLGLKFPDDPETRERMRRKRAMDNIEFDPFSPGEDEFALAKLTLRSPLIAWSFPKNELFYDRFITFRDATSLEKQEWKEGFLWFLKALRVKYDKPMLLKSPPHTGRIQLILELFPDAKFISIHRNPYKVYRSTRQFYDTALPMGYLQQPDKDTIEAGILRRYEEMHQAYFEDRALIPDGHLHELAYEDLVKDMTGEVNKIYEALNLDGFEQVRPRIEAYEEEKHRNYKPNPDVTLPDDIRSKIASRWRQSFEEWGYEV